MRILTVSHFYEQHGGGIERVAANLCREFAGLGIDAVWAASAIDDPPVGGITPLPLRCVDLFDKITGMPMPIPGWGSIRALTREIERCDGVIIHDALYASSILAMLIAKRKGKRTVLIQHIARIPFGSVFLRALMEVANRLVIRPMLRAAHDLVFISHTVRCELLGTPEWRDCSLVFNGVDTAVFHPNGRFDSALPEVPTGSRRILFVGRYVEKKGLAVIRELARMRPDLCFLMAGTGLISPSKWQLSNVYDLGQCSHLELARLYRSADYLLLPSFGEGFPLVIQEALACGLPVICCTPTDKADPKASQWIRGVPISMSDIAGSAQCCAWAIDNFTPSREERTAMAEYAARCYNWRTMAESVLSALADSEARCESGSNRKCPEV